MNPPKYLEDLESSERRKNYFRHLTISFSIVFSFLIIGPLVHEAAHLGVLIAQNCSFSTSFSLSWFKGLYASVTPFCSPEAFGVSVFYLSGYLTTLGFSAIMLLPEKFREHLSAIAVGSSLSILITIGSKGDIQNLVEASGIGSPMVFTALLVIPTLIVSLLGVKRIVELEGQE